MNDLMKAMQRGVKSRNSKRSSGIWEPGPNAMWKKKSPTELANTLKNPKVSDKNKAKVKKELEHVQPSKEKPSYKESEVGKVAAPKEQVSNKTPENVSRTGQELVSQKKPELVSQRKQTQLAKPQELASSLLEKKKGLLDKMRGRDAAPKEQPKELPQEQPKQPEHLADESKPVDPVPEPEAKKLSPINVKKANDFSSSLKRNKDGVSVSAMNAIKQVIPGVGYQDIQDIAQDAEIKVHGYLSKTGKDVGNSENYIFDAAKKVAIDWIRKQRAGKRDVSRTKGISEDFDIAEQKKNKGGLNHDEFNAAIESLPDVEKKLVRGRMEGRSFVDLAQELGMTKSTADRVEKLAREKLRSMIEKDPERFRNSKEGIKERYSANGPIREEVWQEILRQSKQYPIPGDFVRAVMEAMNRVDGQWDAINEGRRLYLSGERYERIKGGKGDNKPDEDFDKEALKKGIKVEMEHTDDKEIAKEIAKDHLTEDENYYDKLEKVESKYGPRHSPPKRIEGAVARLEALADMKDEIDEDTLEDEVKSIAREFDAQDLKIIARKFGVKSGVATKMVALEKILKKICG